MNYKTEEKVIKENIEAKLSRHLGCTPSEAGREQMYKAVALTVKDILTEKRVDFRNSVNRVGGKRVYYMCIEFLLGRSLKNNLCNLGLAEAYEKVLSGMGFHLEDLYECEPDAGLGNGGLGRLAACFMDSLSSLDMNTGCFVRKSSTACRWKCPTIGFRAARCGWCPVPTARLPFALAAM